MLEGDLITAFEMDPQMVAQISNHFAAIFKQPVILTQTVDSSLVGGISVRVGGRVFNGSVAAQLDGVLHQLKLEEEPFSFDWKSVGEELRTRLKDYDHAMDVRGMGEVVSVGDGVANLSGLEGCQLGELVEFESGGFAIVMNLGDHVGTILLGNDAVVSNGMHAFGTGQVLSVPCGNALLGRIVNPLGQPLDGAGQIHATNLRPIEAHAPSILERKSVRVPLETGEIAVDAIVPIGRGQRELIIGDRQTGKTSVALDAILNQKGKDVLCFYVAIGAKASSVTRIIEQLKKNGAMDYTTVICATASDSATMQYIAPYCGCAMAEYFMYQGKDTLIVYDDLTKHAVAYRAMSLLLRRSPGREAYPGDVFYLHSRLLERAASLSDEMGGGSMTALPIIETQAGDISAYIPTNVISITDGQIYLDTELFRSGVRPAVNGGLSVSRVGGAAQTRAMRKVSGQLRLELAQYREMQVFAQFSSEMDASTQQLLAYGALLTDIMVQRNYNPLPMAVQVSMLYVVTRKLLPATMGKTVTEEFKATFPQLLERDYPQLISALNLNSDIDAEMEHIYQVAVKQWLKEHKLDVAV